MVAKNFLIDPDVPIEAKGLYAYLAGYAGNSDECYPSVDRLRKELGISKDRLYKYMNMLVDIGVIERIQTRNGNIKGKVIYRIKDECYCSNMRFPENTENETQEQSICSSVSRKYGIQNARNTDCTETNNNSLNNNNLNNNNNINYQQIADMYNDTCVSFPRLTKLSDARKKAIRARLKKYTVDDFNRLFTMAENSSFLKGQNKRNWSATFDWLINDANMAKVLDGNYADKPERQQEQSANELEEERKKREREEYQEYLHKMLGSRREPSPDDPFQ